MGHLLGILHLSSSSQLPTGNRPPLHWSEKPSANRTVGSLLPCGRLWAAPTQRIAGLHAGGTMEFTPSRRAGGGTIRSNDARKRSGARRGGPLREPGIQPRDEVRDDGATLRFVKEIMKETGIEKQVLVPRTRIANQLLGP